METEQRLGNAALRFSLIRHVALGACFLLFSIFVLLLLGINISNLQSIFLAFTLTLTLFAISLIAMTAGAILSILSYNRKTFTLGEHALLLKRGILTREEISIPYEHIQDLSLNQNATERLFDVSNMFILEKGVGRVEHTLKEIEAKIATNLKSELLKRIGKQKNKTPEINSRESGREIKEENKKIEESPIPKNLPR